MTPGQHVESAGIEGIGRTGVVECSGLADTGERPVTDGDVAGPAARRCHDDAAADDQIEGLLHGPPIVRPPYTRWVTRRFRFRQVDVFTDTPLCGNPLAVFVDADGLTDAEMQALAREMNLSETAFVLPPTAAGARPEPAIGCASSRRAWSCRSRVIRPSARRGCSPTRGSSPSRGPATWSARRWRPA